MFFQIRIFIKKWLDHMLLMTSYFIIIVAKLYQNMSQE